MTGSKCTRVVRSTLPTFQKAIEYDDTGCSGNNETDDTNIANDASNDRYVVLRQVQLVVLVTPWAENLPRLDYLSRQAVAVEIIIGTGAWTDEFWAYP